MTACEVVLLEVLEQVSGWGSFLEKSYSLVRLRGSWLVEKVLVSGWGYFEEMI